MNLDRKLIASAYYLSSKNEPDIEEKVMEIGDRNGGTHIGSDSITTVGNILDTFESEDPKATRFIFFYFKDELGKSNFKLELEELNIAVHI